MVGHRFVIVSTPRYLANIKKIGFKTFDQWWDESYDDEVDDSKRFKKLQNTILQISEWTLAECERVYGEMIPTLIHNQNLVKELSDFKVSNTYNLLDIPIDEVNQNKNLL